MKRVKKRRRKWNWQTWWIRVTETHEKNLKQEWECINFLGEIPSFFRSFSFSSSFFRFLLRFFHHQVAFWLYFPLWVHYPKTKIYFFWLTRVIMSSLSCKSTNLYCVKIFNSNLDKFFFAKQKKHVENKFLELKKYLATIWKILFFRAPWSEWSH